MPPYRDNSNWNDKNEMRCLLILKKLEEQDFPRGMQTKLCRETAAIPGIGLSEETIQRKVGNFKEEAGVIKPTHSSKATKRIYNKFKNLSIPELEKKLINASAVYKLKTGCLFKKEDVFAFQIVLRYEVLEKFQHQSKNVGHIDKKTKKLLYVSGKGPEYRAGDNCQKIDLEQRVQI